jgi:hypothetical protein
MLRMVRRVGVAFGSLVAAWLAVSLVWGLLLPSTGTTGSGLVGLVTVVLGGLIYRDIIRRETRPA